MLQFADRQVLESTAKNGLLLRRRTSFVVAVAAGISYRFTQVDGKPHSLARPSGCRFDPRPAALARSDIHKFCPD